MKKYFPILFLFLIACETKPETTIDTWFPYDESSLLAENQGHPSSRMRYKLIQSTLSDKNEMLHAIEKQLVDFGAVDYARLKPLILEQSIPTIQKYISTSELSYKQLVQWYLYRIALYENDSATALNNIIAINTEAVKEATQKDEDRANDMQHQIYGMPIFLKDNINAEGFRTTAGAAVLQDNKTGDAFITRQLKENGAIILGKANLSEWANFLCDGCPNGYSAVGGQTLNPYGPRKFDTGGSSSGSGSTVAANYAVAAVGTETSGSILSPSSAQSVVGLKPTTGLLSRSGIVPISSTLDTPGPMTKSVVDNAILLSAMSGYDATDEAMNQKDQTQKYAEFSEENVLLKMRFGVITSFLSDSIYALNIEKLRKMGATIVQVDLEDTNLDGFLDLLNADMKRDLPAYLQHNGDSSLGIKSVNDIVALNISDSAKSIPYGQARFYGILSDSTSNEALDSLRVRLNAAGVAYFEQAMEANNLDAFLSINNWSAGYAAAAKYPCITVPMGYSGAGEPKGITFIAKPKQEAMLLNMAYHFEQQFSVRLVPLEYN
ncbi:MAG: amidase [Marivirga sp.]|jgi:amidase